MAQCSVDCDFPSQCGFGPVRVTWRKWWPQPCQPRSGPGARPSASAVPSPGNTAARAAQFLILGTRTSALGNSSFITRVLSQHPPSHPQEQHEKPWRPQQRGWAFLTGWPCGGRVPDVLTHPLRSSPLHPLRGLEDIMETLQRTTPRGSFSDP